MATVADVRFFEQPWTDGDPAVLLPRLLDDDRDTVRRRLAVLSATDALADRPAVYGRRIA